MVLRGETMEKDSLISIGRTARKIKGILTVNTYY